MSCRMTVQGVHEEFLRNEANGKFLNDLDRHRIDEREHRKAFYGTNPIDDVPIRQPYLWVPLRRAAEGSMLPHATPSQG